MVQRCGLRRRDWCPCATATAVTNLTETADVPEAAPTRCGSSPSNSGVAAHEPSGVITAGIPEIAQARRLGHRLDNRYAAFIFLARHPFNTCKVLANPAFCICAVRRRCWASVPARSAGAVVERSLKWVLTSGYRAQLDVARRPLAPAAGGGFRHRRRSLFRSFDH